MIYSLRYIHSFYGDEMKKMLIINGSPRENGVCAELIKQVKPYFTECEIKEYNTYDMSAAACTDCKYCEYHKGCYEAFCIKTKTALNQRDKAYGDEGNGVKGYARI